MASDDQMPRLRPAVGLRWQARPVWYKDPFDGEWIVHAMTMALQVSVDGGRTWEDVPEHEPELSREQLIARFPHP